jgi:hypothetical protein
MAVAAGAVVTLLVLALVGGPVAFMVSVPSYLGPRDVELAPGAGPVVLDWPSLAPSNRVDRWCVSHYTVTVHAKARGPGGAAGRSRADAVRAGRRCQCLVLG